MKLYILTSTLNFHSIMATESCSPFACYAQRGFGDSYFYLAGSFAKKNSIILFSKYPKCIMPITDEEQYSLVIEVDTDKTANFEYEKIGEYHDVVFYQTNKTIYLNPMGCRLIFETNEIRDLILSRAKVRSLDAKVLFYSKAGSFTTQFTESFTYSKEYIESYPDLEFDEKNLLRDKKVNKCKGFLYAYLIGANTSPGEGVSCLQRILKDLSNLIHARIINNDFRLHTEKINELQNQFENEACKYDVVKKKLAESANRLNSSTVKMLQNELKSLGLWDALAHQMFSLPNLSSVYSFEQWNNIELTMTQFIDCVSSASNNCLLVDEIPFILEYEPPMIPLRGSNQEMEIYTAWIKLLLNPKCNLKEFFANKLSCLKNLGIAAKDIMGDEIFANSPERFYYNGLIKNIRDAEDFDLLSFNSFVWQSLAICAKATNPNIDALYSLMTSCAIQDYRCAVAMWGAMCGYADLPKTFFNRIIEGVSIEEAYQYACCIEKRIHGFESAALVTQISQLPKETDILLTLPHGQKRANESCIESALQLEAAQGKFEAYLYILKNLISTRTNLYKEMKRVLSLPESRTHELSDVVKSVLKDFTTKSAKDYHDKALVALELENKVGEPVSFRYMLDDLNISKEIRDNLVAYFNIQAEESGIMRPIKKIGNFFGNLLSGQNSSTNVEQATKKPEVGKLPFKIQNVDAIAAFIREINPGLKDFAYKQIINDLNWVFDPQYATGKTEHELLEEFHAKLVSGQRDPVSRNGKDMKWKNDAYRPIDIEKTISALKQRL